MLESNAAASSEQSVFGTRGGRAPRMRIGFDGRWYGYSGVGSYVSELIHAMGSLEEDFEIILYENPRNTWEHAHGKRVRKVPVHAKRYSVQEQFELAWRCRADRLDVFHAPFYVAPWFAPCPVVVTIHDLIPFLFNIYILPKRQLIRLGYWLAVKKAVRVIAVSQKTADDAVRILDVPTEKTTVVRHGVSPQFCAERGPGEREDLF